MKRFFWNIINSFSVITLLLIVTPVLIVGTDLIYTNQQRLDQKPPRFVQPGDIIEQTYAIGSGQRLSLEVRSNSSFSLTIISGYSLQSYIENPRPEFTLFSEEGYVFLFNQTFSNYSFVYLFWDNSQSINTIMLMVANISISGLDMDLLIVSSFFLVIAGFFEIFTRLMKLILKKKEDNFLHTIQTNTSSPSLTIFTPEITKKNPSFLRTLVILFKKEHSVFPSGALFALLLVSFLVINPSIKFLSLELSSKEISIGMIPFLSDSNQLFWVFWAITIILIGSGIWKSKQESKELRNDLSLPLKRRVYTIESFLYLSLNCVFILFIPYFVAILINYLRFLQILDYFILFLSLSLIFSWQIAIYFCSSTICLRFSNLSFFNCILLVLAILFTISTFVDTVISDTILLPLPYRTNILSTSLILGNFRVNDLFVLLGGSLAIVVCVLLLFNVTMEQLQAG